MHQSIAFAVNPLAGNGRSKKLANQLSMLLHKKEIQHVLFIEKWPITFEDFTEVWIIGGDGTLNYFINHYPANDLPLSLFKGGTGNDFSWKLYGDCSLEEQLERVLLASPKPVDAVSCNQYLYMNCVGIGFDGAVLNSMNTIRFIGGHLGYYLGVVKNILTFKESFFKIRAENIIIEEKLLLVLLCNSSRTGGFHVSPKSEINDGLLNLVISKPLNIIQRFIHLPKVEKGRHLDLPFVKHFTGTKFVVECDRELQAQLDGDLIKAKQFTFELLKGKFLFKY